MVARGNGFIAVRGSTTRRRPGRRNRPQVHRRILPSRSARRQPLSISTAPDTLPEVSRLQKIGEAAKKVKATTNSKHNHPVAPNRFQQDLTTTAPNHKYVGDITPYLWTHEGWLYLAVVIDLYSRHVAVWAMSARMTAQLACDALQMALYTYFHTPLSWLLL